MDLETLAGLLETLVDIPSVTGQEAAIAAHVAARLERRGRGECLRSGPAVVWRGVRRGRPLLVLAGHLDTVPARGNARARRDAERIHGLGASDMKGGLAVMLALLESLEFERLRYDLAAVFYDREEGPQVENGLGRVLAEMPWLAQAALAVLPEPTDAAVEIGCNGSLNLEVRVSGRGAHAARPWTGVNAIERAAPWLAEIVRFPVTPVRVQGLEFRETLQVTTLAAGRARNVVPDELVVNLNHRFPPDRTPAEAEARVRALVPDDFECRVVDVAPPGRVRLDDPRVRELVERSGRPASGKQAWTDVARFTALGVPAVNYGPGLPELSHMADEYCPTPNLLRVHDVLAGFLAEA
jgi:succinyl-diaminopimelate desuccinylase